MIYASLLVAASLAATTLAAPLEGRAFSCPNYSEECADPDFYNESQCVEFRQKCPNKSSWCTSGYTWNDTQQLCVKNAAPFNCPQYSDECNDPDFYNEPQCKKFRQNCPNKSQWCYTGYTWNDVQQLCVKNSTPFKCPDYSEECADPDFYNQPQCKTFRKKCPNKSQWCNSGYTWNNTQQLCVKNTKPTCGKNQYYSTSKKLCFCKKGFVYNSNSQQCVKAVTCPANGSYNWQTDKCVCNSGYKWNGKACAKQSNNGGCPANGHYDSNQKKCVCNSNYWWNGSSCQTGCPANGHYDSSSKSCTCNLGFKWNGSACKAYTGCPTNGEWNDAQGKCQCDSGYTWTGKYCRQNGCPANGHWSSSQNKCVCNSGYVWNGSECYNPGN